MAGSFWRVAYLDGNGGSATLTLVVLATDVGTVKNSVVAKADENNTEVTDSAPDKDVGHNVELSVEKTLVTTGSVAVGDKITYTIKVTNNGETVATNVKVTDILVGPGSIVAGERAVEGGAG